MPRIVIAYFDAGGGHRAAATAIQAALATQPESWDVSLLNLQEHLDALDPMRRLTGVRLQDIYNGMLNRGFTRSMHTLLPALHATLRAYTPTMANRLAQYWQRSNPDIAVSVVPNLNRALALSLKRLGKYIPFVTVLTDFADTPPHFWMEAESEYLVCGSRAAVDQALRMGHARERIFQTSGMVLHPRFYDHAGASRESIRQRLSLAPDLATILVMFGGQGSQEMLQIADALDRCSRPMQIVYICGHNERLCAELGRKAFRVPRMAIGFTHEVASYMAASDLMIGKPGPGSISEAMHFGLPVIVSRNSRTMPQEVYNTYWVEDHATGIVVRDFRQIDSVVDSVLEDGRLGNMRNAAAQIDNKAIFEVPAILRNVLASTPARQDQEKTGAATFSSGSGFVVS